jgi:hypothetical protein
MRSITLNHTYSIISYENTVFDLRVSELPGLGVKATGVNHDQCVCRRGSKADHIEMMHQK